MKKYKVKVIYQEYDEMVIEAETKKEAKELAKKEMEQNMDYGSEKIIDITEVK